MSTASSRLTSSQLNGTSPAQSPMVMVRVAAGGDQGGSPRGDHLNHRSALLGPCVNPAAVGRDGVRWIL